MVWLIWIFVLAGIGFVVTGIHLERSMSGGVGVFTVGACCLVLAFFVWQVGEIMEDQNKEIADARQYLEELVEKRTDDFETKYAEGVLPVYNEFVLYKQSDTYYLVKLPETDDEELSFEEIEGAEYVNLLPSFKEGTDSPKVVNKEQSGSNMEKLLDDLEKESDSNEPLIEATETPLKIN